MEFFLARDISNGDTASNLSNHIQTLRSEVVKLRWVNNTIIIYFKYMIFTYSRTGMCRICIKSRAH